MNIESAKQLLKWTKEIKAFSEGKEIEYRHVKYKSSNSWCIDCDPLFSDNTHEFMIEARA